MPDSSRNSQADGKPNTTLHTQVIVDKTTNVFWQSIIEIEPEVILTQRLVKLENNKIL
jgi:hypothetical protein